jgi:hypothetical protein
MLTVMSERERQEARATKENIKKREARVEQVMGRPRPLGRVDGILYDLTAFQILLRDP